MALFDKESTGMLLKWKNLYYNIHIFIRPNVSAGLFGADTRECNYFSIEIPKVSFQEMGIMIKNKICYLDANQIRILLYIASIWGILWENTTWLQLKILLRLY